MTESNEILSLIIDDLAVLHSAYMPFLKNGGLFIPSENTAQKGVNFPQKPRLGGRIFLILQLLNEPGKLVVIAKIAWITPTRTRLGQCTGFGVHFETPNCSAKTRIEALLGAMPDSARETQTL